MKKLFSSFLASTMLLSTLSMTAMAEENQETPQGIQTQTLTASESDFTFVNGTITKYTGSDSHVVIPVTIGGKEVYAIGDEAFRNNLNLRSVSFATGSLVTEITTSYYKTGVFSGCSNLETVTLPSSLVVLGDLTFSGCNSLTTVTGATNLKTIGTWAFNGCTALSHMEIPDKTTSIKDDSFRDCTDLVIYCNNKSYSLEYALRLGYKYVRMDVSPAEVAADALTYDFKFADGTITAYTGSDSNVEIPASIGGYEVYAIGKEAFRDNATLRNVTFASGSLVTEICAGTSSFYKVGAFSGCRNLVSVVFPDSLLTLGAYSFNNCITLNSVSGGKNLESIGSFAFGSCISLSTIELYDKLTAINSLTGLDDLVIYCYADSKAEEYALQNGIPTMPLSASASTVVPTAPTPESSTGDMTNIPEWAWTYVNFVKDNIMTDISDENYSISATRGTIAQSLYNMCGGGAIVTATHTFGDVGNFGIPIAWCHANSVMNGTSSTEFGTESNVTREQFALILQKAGESLGKTTANADEIVVSVFHDEATISSWARGGMAWAVANGLMNGNNNNLNPQGNITRTEVAVMLYNFDKL